MVSNKKVTREMNKKLIAALLAITMPIWFIPVFVCFIYFMAFKTAYESMLELLEGKAQDK